MKRLLIAAAVLALAFPAAALAWGGSYPTGDVYGSSVNIQVSDSYPVDQTLPQTWATFLGTLVHGPELAKLNLDLMPTGELVRQCGSDALACYDPGTETMYATPEDQLNAPSAREIVIHEYGHHIAANRSDAPWPAEDWGTKRWASYENICSKTSSGSAAPGDEGRNYQLNPGEAFAESYRVLNLTKEGATSIGWDIVDRSFYPDATALSLLQEDVTSPWTGPTLSHYTGSFGYGTTRTIAVKTQLDGTFVAKLHRPAKARMRIDLYAGGTLLASGQSVRYEICGERSLTLKVVRASGSGSFTVDVSKP